MSKRVKAVGVWLAYVCGAATRWFFWCGFIVLCVDFWSGFWRGLLH